MGELGGKRNAAPFQNQKSGVGGAVCAVGPLRKKPWESLSSAGVHSAGTPKWWDFGIS